VELLGLALPPALGVLCGLLVDLGVFQERLLDELLRRVERLLLLELFQLLLELLLALDLRGGFHPDLSS
jgi:hypothetical protein